MSIITLTLVVRSLLIPLFVKQINSARNMQLIQPKMKALQDKYGADRQRLGIETQKLMKDEGVNPMASCFPALLQLPIFMALYQVLYAASAGQARGYFFVHNPDLLDSLNKADVFGASLSSHFLPASPFGSTQVLAIILVLTMSATFFITQKQLMSKNMSPEAMTGQMAQTQKMMLYFFPVMYLFMGVMIPIGVLFYWVTNNLWTLTQQFILIRNNPTPGTPAYIVWEDRMRAKGLDPDEIQANRRAKRSKKPSESTVANSSRTVNPGQTDHSSGSSQGSAGTTTSSSGVVRQQIQRQQPPRQSRAARSTPKPKK